MIGFFPLRKFVFPVIADCICPDVFKDKSLKEIRELQVWEGNKQKQLGQLFRIEEAKQETPTITIQGDVSKLRRIGARMKEGEILVNGNVGMHLGEEMKGGRITIHGNVGGWAGSMMKGGAIEICGSAGDYVGAPYRGSGEGMKGGRIIVHGNVGHEAGAFMKKGIIKIYGSAGQFIGFRMRDGTIYVENDCGPRAGACMVGGKIVIGGMLASVLPTFSIDSIKPRVKIEEEEALEEAMYLFLGDVAESGNGKLYVSKQRNPQLSCYEKFL